LDKSTRLVGTDISPDAFPIETPKNIEMHVQSITKPWPSLWASTFDLVHQRATIGVLTPDAAPTAIESLRSLLKTGGWIQLVEPDMTGYLTVAQKKTHPALSRFTEVISTLMPLMGYNPRPGPALVGWLGEVGFRDVEEKIVEFPIGKAASDPELGRAAARNILSVVGSFKGAAGSKSFP
jgi:hypothetical protein